MSKNRPVLNMCDLNTEIGLAHAGLDWPPILEDGMVMKCIKKIDTSKTSGSPELNARLLKESLACLCSEFTQVLNLGLEQCRFPECWKTATVVVIPKKGNFVMASN